MNYTEDSLEFNLKDLLFYIFYRWKPIVIGSVLIALFLGCMQAYPQYKSASGKESVESLQDEQQVYYDQLSIYTSDLDSTQEKIDALQEYMDLSVLMNADPRNVYLANMSYYIDTNYQIIPGSQYQNPNKSGTLAWHYNNYLRNSSIYVPLAEQTGIEEKYLMELVSISVVDGETLSVSVVHPVQDTAMAILDHLNGALLQYKDFLASGIAEHSLTRINTTCGLCIYDPIEQAQQQAANQMILLLGELQTKQSNLQSFTKANAPATVNVTATFIKWGLAGGLAGGVLMVICFFLLGIFDNRVYSPDYVAAKYNIPSLGGLLTDNAHFDFITLWLRKMECLLVKNSAENLQFLSANIENHCSGAKEVLICSDADADTTKVLAVTLQKNLPDVHFTVAGSLLSDANAVKTLPGCDRVLLVFTRNRTNHKYIRKTLNQICECGKEVAGFLFVG